MDSILMPSHDGVQLVRDAKAVGYAEKSQHRNNVEQEHDGRNGRGNHPTGEEEPKQTGRRQIEKALTTASTPVEYICCKAAEKSNG
jgi:hypothetical protein